MIDSKQIVNLQAIARQLETDSCGRILKLAMAAECHLPSTQNIDELIALYRQLLFPGVFSTSNSVPHGSGPNTDSTLQNFYEQLRRLVCWTFENSGTGEAAGQGTVSDGFQAKVDAIIEDVVERLPEIARIVATDVEAAVDGDPACQNPIEVVICYPGFHALMTHRFAHELWISGATLLGRMIAEWSHGNTGIDIHPQATLGHHLFIDHGTGVVLGQTCHVGNHVRIYQGVTLGALSFPKDAHGKIIREDKRHPTIEDHVVIYANSAILGGNTVVGHHSVIGSSVWLAESVQPYTTVVMEKPRLRFRSQQPTAFDSQFDYQI
jgi:serine O-acetyltransferase